MIVLHYKNLATTKLIPTLKKLNEMAVFDGRTAYRIHKIYSVIFDHFEKSGKLYHELILKYGKVSELGTPELDERGHFIPAAGKEEEAHKALDELMDRKFVIDQNKLHVDALTAKLSPSEIAALEPILDGLES